MPRLLISSLPPNITTNLLSDILSSPPPGVSIPDSLNNTNPLPTDIRVLLTRQGHSRRMAFVGYKTQAQADWIKDVWQGAWINGGSTPGAGSRISIDWARSVEDSRKAHNLPPLNHVKSKRPSQVTIDQRSPKRQKDTSDLSKKSETNDSNLQEFLSVMRPRKNKSLVDDIIQVSAPEPLSTSAPSLTHPKPLEVHPSNLPNRPLSPSCPVPVPLEKSSSPPPIIGDDDDITNGQYLARRMKRNPGGAQDIPHSTNALGTEQKGWYQDLPDDPTSNPTNKSLDVPDAGSQSDSQHDPTDETCILETGRLFLRNLPFSVTEEDLQALFQPFGSITQIHIVLAANRQPKGLAYVTFTRPADALVAYRRLDQHEFQGRLLHILPAVTRNLRIEIGNGISKPKNKVKQEKDAKRKTDSTKQFNWASLYMNADAVASSVADRLQLSKAELFDPNGENPAVKLALAETNIIAETKLFLEKNGINIEAFNQIKSSRSLTTILVKNIPYGTTESVIKSLFSEHGIVLKVLIPPTGTIAVVEMDVKESAKSAFRALAYKRIGNSVLYLEKAPENLWASNTTQRPNSQDDSSTQQVAAETDQEEQGEPGSTLFVKNLSFDTTTERLAARFSALPGYLFSRVQTKPDPKNPANRLSMGFGFVGFRTVHGAEGAMRKMQSCLLDGHSLTLQFARRGHEEDKEESGKDLSVEKAKAGSNKLLVKNVPFETSKQELYQLFGVYGKIKSIRLPKKVDRKTRGFAFVEYMLRQEAEEAMKSLRHTHLLGRHLVIEFAKNEADDQHNMELLRQKSGARFLSEKEQKIKKKKFIGVDHVLDDEDMED